MFPVHLDDVNCGTTSTSVCGGLPDGDNIECYVGPHICDVINILFLASG